MSYQPLIEAAVECSDRTCDGWAWKIEVEPHAVVVRASVRDGCGELLLYQRRVSWTEITVANTNVLISAINRAEETLRSALEDRGAPRSSADIARSLLDFGQTLAVSISTIATSEEQLEVSKAVDQAKQATDGLTQVLAQIKSAEIDHTVGG